MIDVKEIKKIHVRSEGFINMDWDIQFLDGSTRTFNSIDSTPEENDIRVDERMSEFLFSLPSPNIGKFEEMELELEWDLLFNNGEIERDQVTLWKTHTWEGENSRIINNLTGEIET